LVGGALTGYCEKCPPGTYSDLASTACHPLDCGTMGYLDPNNQNACVFCPVTQIWIPPYKIGQGQVSHIQPGHCGCGENQRMEGDTCVCPKDSIIVKKFGPYAPTCSCPAGAHLDEATFACVCPLGQGVANGKCVKLAIQPGVPFVPAAPLVPAVPGRIIRKDCAAVGPRFINSPRNPAVCIRCAPGTFPNAERSACVAVRPPPGVVAPPFVRPRPFQRPPMLRPLPRRRVPGIR